MDLEKLYTECLKQLAKIYKDAFNSPDYQYDFSGNNFSTLPMKFLKMKFIN